MCVTQRFFSYIYIYLIYDVSKQPNRKTTQENKTTNDNEELIKRYIYTVCSVF